MMKFANTNDNHDTFYTDLGYIQVFHGFEVCVLVICFKPLVGSETPEIFIVDLSHYLQQKPVN